MTILPDLATAGGCPICRADHMHLDPFRTCPTHGHELQPEWARGDGERIPYTCPVRRCGYQRWIPRTYHAQESKPMTTTPAIHHPQTATPTTELAIRDDQQRFDKYQLAALRQIGIVDAPNAELAVFFHYCKAHRLDPFSRHVTMINYGGQWTIQTEIDGYRFIGHRAANRRGDIISVGAPTYIDMDGQRHPHWVQQGPPGMVEVTIVKNGAPFTGQANYFEFVQVHGPFLKGGKPNPKAGQPRGLWEKMPANQTRKCAEAQAWRMAYQDEFADIPTELPIPAAPPAPTTWHAETVEPQPERETAQELGRAIEAVQEQWRRLGVDDAGEQLNLTAMLASADFIPDSYGDLSAGELLHAAERLTPCKDIGQVHALLDHGDAPTP